MVVGSVGLLAAPAACSGNGGAGGVEFTEVRVEVDEYDSVNGVVAWEDGFVAVTSGGVVVRSADGERWAQVETTGLAGKDDSAASTSFAGIAAGDGFLLIAGTRSVSNGEDNAVFAPLVWRSDDGEQWEQLDRRGLAARSLDFVVARDDGFLLFGTEEIPTPADYVPTDEEEEDGELPATIDVTSTWSSDDGEQWEQVGDHVLPPGENSLEGVAAAAVIGDQWLASLGVECSGCYDDYAFALSKSEDGGATWAELDESGLDDIRLANTDVIPRVVGFEDGFVAVGTSQDGDDTVATLWRSADGEKWADKMQLGGPREYEYAADIDAMAATETGVIVLELRGDELAVWRVDLS